FLHVSAAPRVLLAFPTRRSSDLIKFKALGSPNPPPVNTFFASPKNGMATAIPAGGITATFRIADWGSTYDPNAPWTTIPGGQDRSEEHTSELQSRSDLVCRLLLE